MYSTEEIELANKKISSEKEYEMAAASLKVNPENSLLRKYLLIYMIQRPHLWWSPESQAHVLWFLRNQLEVDFPWLDWAMIFHASHSAKVEAIKEIQNYMNTRNINSFALRNAVLFLWNIDETLVLKYLGEIQKIAPKDPFYYERLALLLYKKNGIYKKIDDAIYQVLKIRFKMSWSHKTFVKTERAMSFLLKPSPLYSGISRLALILYQNFQDKLIWDNDYLFLNLIGGLQFNDAEMIEKSQQILKSVSDRNTNYNTTEKYAGLSRIDIWKGQSPTVNIDLMLADTVYHVSQISPTERLLISDLKSNGHVDLVDQIISVRKKQIEHAGSDSKFDW